MILKRILRIRDKRVRQDCVRDSAAAASDPGNDQPLAARMLELPLIIGMDVIFTAAAGTMNSTVINGSHHPVIGCLGQFCGAVIDSASEYSYHLIVLYEQGQAGSLCEGDCLSFFVSLFLTYDHNKPQLF
jgi:hypothetical protein